MKQIDLIYKQEILDKLPEGSMLRHLIVSIEPFIFNAMKEVTRTLWDEMNEMIHYYPFPEESDREFEHWCNKEIN